MIAHIQRSGWVTLLEWPCTSGTKVSMAVGNAASRLEPDEDEAWFKAIHDKGARSIEIADKIPKPEGWDEWHEKYGVSK